MQMRIYSPKGFSWFWVLLLENEWFQWDNRRFGVRQPNDQPDWSSVEPSEIADGLPGPGALLGGAGIADQPQTGLCYHWSLGPITKGFHWWSGSCLKCSRFRRCRLRISSNPSGSRSASTLAVTSCIFKGIRPTVRIWSKNMFLKTFFLRSSSFTISSQNNKSY